MGIRHLSIGLLLGTAAMALCAEPATAHRLGDHPAVVVQRLQAQRGYDYASKFYPHPAWLYLRASQAPDTTDTKAPPAPDERPAALAATTGPASPSGPQKHAAE